MLKENFTNCLQLKTFTPYPHPLMALTTTTDNLWVSVGLIYWNERKIGISLNLDHVYEFEIKGFQ